MKKWKPILFCLLVVGTMFASGSCSAKEIDWDSNIIKSTGMGIAPEYATNPGQAQALARSAAIVDAYRNLAATIYGVELENESTIEQLAVKKDTIKTSVSGLIKNARILDEEVLPNGAYQIVMAVRIFGGSDSLSGALYQNKENALPTPAPTVKSEIVFSPAANALVPVGQITGVVVDCRGLGLERVMSPVIRDTSGRAIYGTEHVDSSWVIKNGMAGYVHDEDPTGLTRAGNHPIFVKAVSLDNHNGDPIIAKDDADKILSANQESGFLRKCPVVFIQ